MEAITRVRALAARLARGLDLERLGSREAWILRGLRLDPLRKTEGAGKAGWPPHPGLSRKKWIARARKPQVQAVINRPSPRDGLRLIRARLSEPMLDCHCRRRDASASRPT